MTHPSATPLEIRATMVSEEIAAKVKSTLAAMTFSEKVEMMSGQGFFELFAASNKRWGSHPYRAGGGCERLNIAPFYFTDGPRGVARGNSTCFPCSMARGATFDPDLERRIGEIIGIEARAQGCNLSGAVCVNLLRHPAWGRAQETYGEDSHHLGVMGSALAQGIQAHNVAATVKHFAANSIENARFKVDVRIDERTLREVYLPHFKRIIDDGCATVMSAYNKLNGEFCGENQTLLTDILRDEWGFTGFVHSDWVFGVHSVQGAAAGLDVENPEPLVFGPKLLEAVENGNIDEGVIETACRRILTTYYRFADAPDPLPEYTLDMVACDTHRQVALEAAEKSVVLLQNRDQALPLRPDTITRVAVLGKLAHADNIGDLGSSRVQPPYVTTIADGLNHKVDQLPNQIQLAFADEDDLAQASNVARDADAVVIVAGYTAQDEGEYIPGDISLDALFGDSPAAQTSQSLGAPAEGGETPEPAGGDRDSLSLPQEQIALIEQAAAVNSRVIVLIVAGSAVIVNEWHKSVSAIMQTFYSGMEGGRAIARLLFGDVSPSGKLPFTVPASADQLPDFDKNADSIEYGPEHGYILADKHGYQPTFCFGHGLSYARFEFGQPTATIENDELQVSVNVVNVGAQHAAEVVQVYIGTPNQAAERPDRLLRGFRRVELAPNQQATVSISIPLEDLRWWNPASRVWELEFGRYVIWVGPSSARDLLVATELTL